MNGRTQEHSAARPTVNVVQLLITISWTKEKGEHRILGSEEEHDGELGKGEESCSVGVRDEDGILGDADDHSSKVPSDQDHWRGG